MLVVVMMVVVVEYCGCSTWCVVWFIMFDGVGVLCVLLCVMYGWCCIWCLCLICLVWCCVFIVMVLVALRLTCSVTFSYCNMYVEFGWWCWIGL